MTEFPDFEAFAVHRWPKHIPTDCMCLNVISEDDCFETKGHLDAYCASCYEYALRMRAWNFRKNEPRKRWWTRINMEVTLGIR